MSQLYPFWIILGIFMVAWLARKIISKKFHPTEDRPKLVKAFGIAHIVHMAVSPLIMIFMMELISNPDMSKLRPEGILGSFIAISLAEIFMVGLLPFWSIGLVLCYVFCMFSGVSNYYLLSTREIPAMFSDLTDFFTATQVAGDYDMTPTFNCLAGYSLGLINIFVIFLFAGCYRKMMQDYYSYRKSLIVSAAGLLSLFLIITNVTYAETFDFELNMWRPGATYTENSLMTSAIAFAQFSAVNTPDGYSKEDVRTTLEEAEKAFDEKYGDAYLKAQNSNVRPDIYGIMDESFADFTVLNLKCPLDHIPYYKSLKNDPNTIWYGYTYVSTYGGGTARTEFEYLTGFSMNMFPKTQPYSQFNFKDIATSVKTFKQLGYDVTAMHPENPNNYRRKTVYPNMGFDDFVSYADYVGYEPVDIYPTRVSDIGDFKKAADYLNEKENPTFIHNVTMQNHGGYKFEVPDELQVKVDKEYEDMEELVNYETLLTRTDSALEEILDYFRNSKTPIVICFYGDHQPKFSTSEFIDERISNTYQQELGEVGNNEKRYATPFFIWSNFDVENYLKAYSYKGNESISMNYLGVVTRAMAGLKLTSFDKYLLMLRDKIPVINETGYLADNSWHAINDENEYRALIDDYNRIQYAGMFDIEGLEDLFYLTEDKL